MTMFLAPYTAIADVDGSPLDAGFVFIGEQGKNPESSPVSVFWDAEFTIPAAQPIRTRNGYPVRNGSPAKIYLREPMHSISVKNRNGSTIFVDVSGAGLVSTLLVRPSGVTVEQTFKDIDQEINTKADQTYVEEQLELKANAIDVHLKSETYTQVEVNNLVAPKADQTYVDEAIGAISTDANKQYATLAAANADIANIVVGRNVFISEAINGGYWYKATAEATTLTKSAFDPLVQAKGYTDNETLQISNDDFTSHFKDKAYVNTDTGAEVATQNGLLTKYIKVSKNDVINLYAVTTNANVAKVAYYDENKVFIRADSDSNATARLKHYPVAQDGYVRCFSRTETDPNYSLTITRDFGKTELAKKIGNPMQIANENLSTVADNTTPTTTANVSYVVDGTTIAVTSTNTAVGSSNIGWYLYDLTAINLAISLTKAILTTAGILLRVRFRDSENNVLASTDISPILQSDGTYTYSSDITAPSSYYSIAIALMMQNAPQGTITFDANNLILIDKDAQLPTTDEYIDNRVLKKTNPISARVTALENKDIPDRSLLDQYVQKGLIINTADKLIETTLQPNFISWWGSSSVMYMHPFLQAMASELGITNIINGGKGSETAEKHAARMGAVPAKCLVVGGVITASTPITINDFGTRPDSLLAYTGTLNGVTGTLSYAQATEPRYLFTRTDSSADVAVSPTQVFEFIPNYDQKFMYGTVILNVGKNSITDGKNAEYVMQYTDAMYNYVKNYFKRVLIINHYSNQSYTSVQRGYINA